MALYDNQSVVLDRGSRVQRILGPIRERLSSVVHGGSGQGGRKPAHRAEDEADTVDGELVLRFPLARRGYDTVAVDEYVTDLEEELAALDRELVELRGQSQPADEVEIQIKRVGQQTSAVLMAAHEQSEEILRSARAEADRCLAEATTTARKVTARSEARLHELEAQNQAVCGERSRLLTDIRAISTALVAVADSAEEKAGEG